MTNEKNKKQEEKDPYRYITDEQKLDKIELWIVALNIPGFFRFILLLAYNLLMLPWSIIKSILSPFILPWNLVHSIPTFIFWFFAILSPIIMLSWIFNLIKEYILRH